MLFLFCVVDKCTWKALVVTVRVCPHPYHTGFNSDGEAEAEDDWLSEPAAPIANKNLSANNLLSFNLNSNGNLLSSLAGVFTVLMMV